MLGRMLFVCDAVRRASAVLPKGLRGSCGAAEQLCSDSSPRLFSNGDSLWFRSQASGSGRMPEGLCPRDGQAISCQCRCHRGAIAVLRPSRALVIAEWRNQAWRSRRRDRTQLTRGCGLRHANVLAWAPKGWL